TTNHVSASSSVDMVFTYTAPTGGVDNATLKMTVPSGWTAPQTSTSSSAGYTTASTGTASASGQDITVSGVTLSGGSTMTMSNGTVEVTVPANWSAPSTTSSDPGYTTSSTGTVGVSGQTITVSGVTLAGGATLTITYANGNAPDAAHAATGTWTTRERSTAG